MKPQSLKEVVKSKIHEKNPTYSKLTLINFSCFEGDCRHSLKVPATYNSSCLLDICQYSSPGEEKKAKQWNQNSESYQRNP